MDASEHSVILVVELNRFTGGLVYETQDAVYSSYASTDLLPPHHLREDNPRARQHGLVQMDQLDPFGPGFETCGQCRQKTSSRSRPSGASSSKSRSKGTRQLPQSNSILRAKVKSCIIQSRKKPTSVTKHIASPKGSSGLGKPPSTNPLRSSHLLFRKKLWIMLANLGALRSSSLFS